MRRVFSRRDLALVLSAAVGFSLTHVLLDGVVVLGGTVLAPSVGLAVPLGVTFGLPAAVGLALGVVVRDALRLVISLETAFAALSLFLLAAIPYLLWRYEVGPVSMWRERLAAGPRWWLEFALVATTAALGAAAFRAWGFEFLGSFPFYVSFLTTFLEYLLATVLVAPALIVAFRVGRVRDRLGTHPDGDAVTPSRATTRFEWLAYLVPVAWVVGGLIGSVGFGIRERVSLQGFRDVNVGFLYDWIHPDVFGYGGRRAQVVFGAIMMILAVYVVRRSGVRPEGSD